MKRFKEWWKDKWQYTSFRYGVIIVALLILCVVVSIYADIRDRREIEAMGSSDVTTVAESE